MVRELIELVAKGIEALAVFIIVGGIIYGIGRYFIHTRQRVGEAYKRFKDRIGKSLLLGLEFLVAADIIRTVALSPTAENVVILGVLVLIRTFLSWSLVVEIDGRWPWQVIKRDGETRLIGEWEQKRPWQIKTGVEGRARTDG
jgi:uncharacterized membrane protein